MIKKSLKKEDKKPVPKGQAGGQRNPLAVNGLVLQYSTLNDIFRTKGILLPDEEVDLSFETSGKITNIHFKEGSYVNGSGVNITTKTPKVTGKGQQYFINKFLQ